MSAFVEAMIAKHQSATAKKLDPRQIAVQAVDLCLKGLAHSDAISEDVIPALKSVALEIVSKNVNNNDVRTLKVIYRSHGVPFCADHENAVSYALMAYWNRMHEA